MTNVIVSSRQTVDQLIILLLDNYSTSYLCRQNVLSFYFGDQGKAVKFTSSFLNPILFLILQA